MKNKIITTLVGFFHCSGMGCKETAPLSDYELAVSFHGMRSSRPLNNCLIGSRLPSQLTVSKDGLMVKSTVVITRQSDDIFLIEWSSNGDTPNNSNEIDLRAFSSPIIQEKDFKIEIVRQEK